jgi:DNA-binding NarL/FixJ family response regulator
MSIISNLPAGLIDNNIEFFTHKGEIYVLQNGEVKPYHLSIEGRRLIQLDMQHNIELVARLSKQGYHGYELEKKWVDCRFGSFNAIPDIDIQNNQVNLEYHECSSRSTCPLSGIVCKLPSGPGGELSHKEIETIKAIATGEPAKQAADRLGVSFNTIRAYLKSVHNKLNAHSRADVMNFAYRNNIINHSTIIKNITAKRNEY